MHRVQQAPRYDDRAMSDGMTAVAPRVIPACKAAAAVARCPEFEKFRAMMRHTCYKPGSEQPTQGSIALHEWLLTHRSTPMGAEAQSLTEQMLAGGLQLRLGSVALSAATNFSEYERYRTETDLQTQKARAAPEDVLGTIRAQRNAMYNWLFPSRSMVWRLAQRLPDQLEQRNVAPLAHYLLTMYDFFNFVTVTATPLDDAVAPPATTDTVMARLPNGGRCALVPARHMSSADDVCVLTMAFDRDMPVPEGMATRDKSECPGRPYKLFVHCDTADFVMAIYRGMDAAWGFPDEFARLYGTPEVGTYDELIGHERCLAVQRSMSAKYLQDALSAISYLGPSRIVATLSAMATPEPLGQAIASAVATQ